MKSIQSYFQGTTKDIFSKTILVGKTTIDLEKQDFNQENVSLELVLALKQRVLDLIEYHQKQVATPSGPSGSKRAREEEQEPVMNAKALAAIRKAQLNTMYKSVQDYFKTKKINTNYGCANAGAAKGQMSMNPTEYEAIFCSLGINTAKKESKVAFSREYKEDDLELLFRGVKDSLVFKGKAYQCRSFQAAYQVGTVEMKACFLKVNYSKNTLQLKFEMGFYQVSDHEEY